MPEKLRIDRVAQIRAQPRSGGVALVLDTNVLTEVFTQKDLEDAAERAGSPEQGLQDPEVDYRINRIRYTTILVWVCSLRKWATASLLHEFMRILDRRAPPDAKTLDVAFTKMIIHFVRDQVLAGWTMANFTEVPEDVASDEADDMLLALAIREVVPLITHEGHTIEGIRDTNKGKPNLRGKAKTAGVEVYTPHEYVEKLGIVAELEGRDFLDCFRSKRSAYQGVPGQKEQTAKLMNSLYAAYEFILLDRQ